MERKRKTYEGNGCFERNAKLLKGGNPLLRRNQDESASTLLGLSGLYDIISEQADPSQVAVLDILLRFASTSTLEDATHLTNYLIQVRDLESKQMIAKMLFQWVIEKIVTSAKNSNFCFKDSIVEKTMLLCLDTLSEDQTKSILSTQVVTKLVVAILGSTASDEVQSIYSKVISHYRPTMDVACKSVLCKIIPSSPLLQPTIQWLLWLHRNGKGNPKTTFLLVSDLNVLLLLGESALSRQFISEVLFDPKQHIEGFWALLQVEPETDSTFKTYHTSLFCAIHEGVNDKEKRQDMNSMLPLLLECFLEQSKNFFDTRQHRKGLPLATIQFRMFCKWSRHLLSSIENSLVVLSKMLQLVEQSNAFLPNKECTSYLSEFILPLIEVAKDETTWPKTCDCFCSLLKLNHTIFADHMGSVVTTSIQSDQFMTVFVDTFKRLRQQHFIYSMIIKNADRGQVFERIRCTDFSNHLVSSFEKATFFEIKETFGALGAWHKQRFDIAGKSEKNTLQIIAEIVVPSVIVDHGNAKDVAIICQKLVLQAKDFHMAALCLNLHLKCLFWLGKGSKLQLPDDILHKLDTAEVLETEKEAVATLWCHRLHETIFLIQEKEICGLQALEAENKSEILKLKQHCQATANGVSNMLCWKVVLENFPSWIPYALAKDIELFCRWMWKMIGEHQTIDNTHIVILDLLGTSYFHENEVIAEKLRLLAFTEVLEAILGAVSEPDKLEIATGAYPDACNSPELRPKPAFTLASNKDSGDLQNCADKSVNILTLVLQLPKTTTSSSTKSKCLELLLQIDLACRSMALSATSTERVTSFFATIAKCRTLMSTELDDGSTNTQVDGLEILYSILLSMIELILSKSEQPYSVFDEAVKASGKLLASVTCLRTTPTTSTCIEKVTELFLSLERTMGSISLSCQHAILELLRFFASAMIESFAKEAEGPRSHTKSKQLYVSLRGLVVQYEELHSDGELLVECGRMRCLLDGWAAVNQFSTVGPKFLSGILGKIKWDVSVETVLDIYTLVSSYEAPIILGAVVKACKTIPDDEYDRLYAPRDALFCNLITATGPGEFQDCINMLLKESSDPSSALRFLCRCLTQAKKEDQKKVLHLFGRELFDFSMKGLGNIHKKKHSFRTEKAALQLINELLLRRGVFAFKESDLSGLLSKLADVLNETIGSNEVSAMMMIEYATKVYLTAIQRYTKALYACAPMVCYTLRQFLISLLEGPGNVLDGQGRSFNQICNLLSSSREVYKKYVVGVVLEFARRLDGRNYDFVLPAMYALLDMMSTHENEQLNALMDVKARSLFKPIYDAYQKHHVFKG